MNTAYMDTEQMDDEYWKYMERGPRVPPPPNTLPGPAILKPLGSGKTNASLIAEYERRKRRDEPLVTSVPSDRPWKPGMPEPINFDDSSVTRILSDEQRDKNRLDRINYALYNGRPLSEEMKKEKKRILKKMIERETAELRKEEAEREPMRDEGIKDVQIMAAYIRKLKAMAKEDRSTFNEVTGDVTDLLENFSFKKIGKNFLKDQREERREYPMYNKNGRCSNNEGLASTRTPGYGFVEPTRRIAVVRPSNQYAGHDGYNGLSQNLQQQQPLDDHSRDNSRQEAEEPANKKRRQDETDHSSRRESSQHESPQDNSDHQDDEDVIVID